MQVVSIMVHSHHITLITLFQSAGPELHHLPSISSHNLLPLWYGGNTSQGLSTRVNSLQGLPTHILLFTCGSVFLLILLCCWFAASIFFVAAIFGLPIIFVTYRSFHLLSPFIGRLASSFLLVSVGFTPCLASFLIITEWYMTDPVILGKNQNSLLSN